MRFSRGLNRCAEIAISGFSIGWLLALANIVQAQDYRLQSGDTLRAEIINLNTSGWTSMVDTAGFVRFPFIGRHLAAGKTLEELEDEIAVKVFGKRVSVLNGVDETFIVLDETSIFIDIAEYRPITVLGAVASPSRIDYRPGMTVRAAVGIAGGTLLSSMQDSRPDREAFLTSRISELQKTEAWLMVDLWRIRGQLDDALAEAPPQQSASVLETRLGSDVMDDVKLQIAEARRERNMEVEELEARIGLSELRISYLLSALNQYEVVSRAEEERLASLLTLQDRGLAVADSVNDARSGALSASSRLLLTEADLSETRRELATLNQELNSVDLVLRQDLLAEQVKVQRSLDETAARLQGAREELVALTGMMFDDEDARPAEPEVVLHRQDNGSVKSGQASLNDVVFPGDVIEVRLIPGSLSPQ